MDTIDGYPANMFPKITRTDASAVSIFAALDSEDRLDDAHAPLAKAFTYLLRNRSISSYEWNDLGCQAEMPEIYHVHTTESSGTKRGDDGRLFNVSYAIWAEGDNTFGAWVKSHTGAGILEMIQTEDDTYIDVVEIFYPENIKPMVIKERMITETTYMIPMKNMDLPVAWVTYQNEQSGQH